MKGLSVVGVVLVLLIALAGCTDATKGKLFAYGDSAKVECWSGGTLIYAGTSTGKIKSEESSDGYFFKDKTTGKFMEVSGNCTITYGG